MKNLLKISCLAASFSLLAPFSAGAAKGDFFNLDKAAIRSGYTMSFDSGSLLVSVWPDAMSKASKFRFKKDNYPVAPNKGYRRLSDMYKIRCRQGECGQVLKDLTVKMSYANPGFNKKYLMYYKPKDKSWHRLDTRVNEGAMTAEAETGRKNMRQIAVFERLHTARRHLVPISDDYVKKINHGNQFRLNVKPGTFRRERIIRVKQVNQYKYPDLPEEDILSNLFHFKVIDGKKPKKDIIFKIRSKKHTENPVQIKKYTKRKGWIDLETEYNRKKMLARTRHAGKRGVFGLFESSDFQIGGASWYNWNGAASNDYPMGTELKVTNLANGRSCHTTVVSTGPFTPGLIIDLPLDKFSEIADPGTGIIQVRVERK